MAGRITLKNFHHEVKLFTGRMISTAVIIVILSLILIGRLAHLQLFEHNLYTTLSDKNQLTLVPVEPNRGLIYDRNGILLAENLPSFSLDIIPNHVGNLKSTLEELQQLFNIDDETISQFHHHRRQHRAFEPVPLLMKLNEDQVALFYVNQHRFPGVMVNARLIRHYALGDISAEVLGYVGRINEADINTIDSINYSATNYIGKNGIEKFYEDQLHGYVGYKQIEVNATGQMVRTLKEIPPIPGDNVFLSIDSQIQQIVHTALEGERGAAVAIKPDTGEILAMVSHPGFDPNVFVNGISNEEYETLKKSAEKPLYNRAIRGQYPIASTIKPFLGLKALDEGLVTPEDTIFDAGGYSLPNNDHLYHCWVHKGHGRVDINRALMVSCDTYFYDLSQRLGIRKIDEILTQFGFGCKTGLDMNAELPGNVPTPEWKLKTQHARWYTGDTVLCGIGQGFMLTTPLQLAASTATLANRGIRYQPHLMLKVQHPDGTEKEQEPTPLLPVTLQSPEHWETIIHGMQGVISDPSGTGRSRFGVPRYTVAAKTGTAQVVKLKQYETKEDDSLPKQYRDHSIFIAFAPVDRPQIAVAVVVENAKLAPQIARKIIDSYLNSLPKEPQDELSWLLSFPETIPT